jgi:hypothetical protein
LANLKMNQLLRFLIAAVAIAQSIAWTFFTAQVWQWGGSGGGAGDGAGGGGSEGAAVLGLLLIGVIWLLPVSPHLCIAAGSLNLIQGKSLRVAYVYSLVRLSIVTLIMVVSLQQRFLLMALGNIIEMVLWVFSQRSLTACRFSLLLREAHSRVAILRLAPGKAISRIC